MKEAIHIPAPDVQLFGDVFNASPIGIAVENLDGQPLFVNPALCSILGFNAEELCGKHCVDLSPPEDAEKDYALLQQLRAGAIDHYQMEKRYFRRDGSLVWGNLSVSVLKGGPSLRLLAMVEDITDKKKAEETRFWHAAIVESSEDSIASVTLDGVIESWNRAAQRIFGYTKSEAIGQSVRILVPPERQDEESKMLETLNAGGRIAQFETVRVTKTGKRIDVSLAVSPIKDSTGKTVGFSGITRDITRRRRAESALRAREELLKIFVKHVPAGVAMFDREMRYLQVSDRWCADYNLDSSEAIGRSLYDLFTDIPERWREVHRRTLAGETLRADEDRWDREGGTAWIHWETRPWRSHPDGPPEGILIFAEEITRRKQMEEELSRVSQKLIEAHEEERTRIARELHDDINQRLAVLAVTLESLEQEPSTSAAELRREIGKIVKNVQDLGNDVQDISHQLHSSKLEYLGLASAAASFCKELSRKPGIEIDFHSENVSKDLPKEIALCLFRVLQESLQNAIKHSGSRRFQASLTRTSSQIELIVRDSGRGFDPEDAMKGSGLGLTSMKERLKLVNGTLSIDSQGEHGTTIQARVPLAPKAKSAHLGTR